MENYSLFMGAAAVMKMAVEMAAVSMEKPSGGTSPLRQVPEQRLLSPDLGFAMVAALEESCWLRQVLQELHRPISRCTVVYCDNVSAVYMSANPVQHKRTKHIEIDIHFVRDKVALGEIRVLHVPTTSQFADIFTKGLPTAVFTEFRTSLNVRRADDATAGGC
ncbi:hypothetical protein QYE76_035048 [Lolium multiflorum]|uniref:Uncharacterized protein n=1 Tax=Lolium multiflorum TaxID=4521 RepID=A0AAD8VNM7_LOLMU|nr:hypothetical protein QYE76_035048 [Lolium multiflorum]